MIFLLKNKTVTRKENQLSARTGIQTKETPLPLKMRLNFAPLFSLLNMSAKYLWRKFIEIQLERAVTVTGKNYSTFFALFFFLALYLLALRLSLLSLKVLNTTFLISNWGQFPNSLW